jgi:hypothetical protein
MVISFNQAYMIRIKHSTTIFIILFFISNLFLASYYIDLWANDNTTSRVLPIISYLEQCNFQIDKYQKLTGDKSYVAPHYYTDKAPLPALVILPFAGVLKSMGVLPNTNGSYYSPAVYAVGGFICGSLVFAFIVTLTFKALTRNKSAVSEGISPVLLAMLPLYGSFIFVFSGTFFGHLFAGGLLLGSYILLNNKKFMLSGLLLGLGFVSDYPLALIGAIWFAQIWFREKPRSAILYAAGIVPSLIFIMAYNAYFTGSPFTMLYKFVSQDYAFMKDSYGFALPKPEALWGLIFSQYRGVLFYAPMLILFIYYFALQVKVQSVKILTNNYLLAGSVIFVLFIASYQMWWGGWCWGPRHLTTIGILWMYEGILMVSKRKVSIPVFASLAGLGLLINFLAKFTVVYSVPSDVKYPLFQTVLPNVMNGNFNPNNLASIMLHSGPGFAAFLFVMIFAGLVYGLDKYYKLVAKQQ